MRKKRKRRENGDEREKQTEERRRDLCLYGERPEVQGARSEQLVVTGRHWPLVNTGRRMQHREGKMDPFSYRQS